MMAAMALIISIAALGACIWLGWEIAGLKQRWGRLYGLRAAMVETEAALQELMSELDEAGQALLQELDSRLGQAQDGSSTSLGQEAAAGGQDVEQPASQSSLEEKRAAVIGLAERGYTVEEIARDVELPKGEVRLILDLERFRQ